MILFSACLVLFLAYANGANDNFKGVATLHGSNTATYKQSLQWASIATFFGSITAVFLANTLLAKFSGKGIAPESAIAMQQFPLVIAGAAAVTVMLATYFGFPISTTHALTGALMGSAVASTGGWEFLPKLGSQFFAPLLLSPLISIALAVAIYPLFRKTRAALGVTKQTCLCIGNEIVPVNVSANGNQAFFSTSSGVAKTITLDSTSKCIQRYDGVVYGIDAEKVLNVSHFATAGLVCFSRALNDTPKIAALLLVASAMPKAGGILFIGLSMLVGGLLHSRKIAETMSHNITTMNNGQAFTANLITGALVLSASRFGLPVSTTHVSCGTLFGIGIVTGQAKVKTILSILLAWVTTLPVAFLFSFLLWKLSA